jgi:hypothetical protein
MPGELKSHIARSRARKAKTTTYINNADNVTLGDQNNVRVTNMETGAGGYFENHDSSIGIQGPNARVRRMSQRTVRHEESDDGVDLRNLIAELDKLRTELAQTADTAGKSRAVAEVHDAKEAAERSDKGAIERHLLNAGHWALDAAMRVGLPIAEAALKQALGISS